MKPGFRLPLAGLVFPVCALLGAVLLQGCTIYSGCADIYGNERSMGVHLTEACSRGVTFARKSRGMAYQNCRGNYFHDDAIAACEHGIRLFHDGREGDIMREGLDH